LPQKEYGILQKEQKRFPWRKNFNDEDETFRERHFLLRWLGRERERERRISDRDRVQENNLLPNKFSNR
jgi:hypothetical protein